MYLQLLENNLKQGILHLHMPDGNNYRFGDHGLEAHWQINQKTVIDRIARDWEFELGETYINGGWSTPPGELRNLLCILRANFTEYSIKRWLQPVAKMFQEWNKISRSYLNVSRHYELEETFFQLFLDDEMHYSCAYFAHDGMSLDQAQQEKCKLIAAKLLLRPGHRVLDVGSGWGSLAFYLAEVHDVQVTGLTLSTEQLSAAKRKAKERGLDNVQFKLQDYREHSGTYDRIVSIGMFEHVGKPYYGTYFQKINSMLPADGVALVHTIGRSGPPCVTNPWIRKHIFPGGSVPALSEISQAIEKADIMLTDLEILRLHYALTLNAWQQRLHANKHAITEAMGERFYRMWNFYLTICEISFQYSDSVVFQLQMAKQHDVVPPTRDYLYSNSKTDPEIHSL